MPDREPVGLSKNRKKELHQFFCLFSTQRFLCIALGSHESRHITALTNFEGVQRKSILRTWSTRFVKTIHDHSENSTMCTLELGNPEQQRTASNFEEVLDNLFEVILS
jgi:hypothetical protein